MNLVSPPEKASLYNQFYYKGDDQVYAVRKRLLIAGGLMLLMTVLGTLGYWILGQGEWSVLKCLYMVVITITTVGYGEVIPIANHEPSLVFTLILMIFGLGISFYFLSALTAFIIEGDLKEVIWRRKMGNHVENLNNHYIICGVGQVGHKILLEMIKEISMDQIVILDHSMESLAWLERQFVLAENPQVAHLVRITGDATEDDVLRSCGIERAQGLITALPSDQDNLFVIVSAKYLNPSIRIVSRATNERTADKMRQAGADSVVCPNTIGGLRMASELLRPRVINFIDLIVRDYQDNRLTVEEITIPNKSVICDKRLMESGIRSVTNVLILSVLVDQQHHFNPPPDFILKAGMRLFALGDRDDLTLLRRHLEQGVSLSQPLLDAPPSSRH